MGVRGQVTGAGFPHVGQPLVSRVGVPDRLAAACVLHRAVEVVLIAVVTIAQEQRSLVTAELHPTLLAVQQ